MREFVLAKQLLKSGTSIGANVEEALQGQSKADFVAKLSISLKEAHETEYWLRIVQETEPSLEKTCSMLRINLNSVISLLTAIIKSIRQNLNY